MDTVALIAEVRSIVSDASFTDVQALGYLNRGLKAAANKMLLPWLADGTDTLTTDTSVSVTLPSDYHKNLFSASVGENQVNIVTSLKALADDFGTIQASTNGEVSEVCAANGELFYQNVPSTAADIVINYYRLPAVLVNLDTSDPEWDNDDFDNLLINYAAWQRFALLEQGVEGQKISTDYHKNEYLEYLSILKLWCYREGENYATIKPSANKVW